MDEKLKHTLTVALFLIAIGIVCILGIVSILTPKMHTIDVKFTEWTYSIHIQILTPVKKEGRTQPPSDAYNIERSPRTETITETDENGTVRTKTHTYTWYKYTVDEWKYSRDITTHGTDKNPYWGDIILKGSTDPRGIGEEKVSGRTELYSITGAENGVMYTIDVPKEIWEQVIERQDYINFKQRKVGNPYEITIAK
jgi:hypothetical protein